MYMGWETVPYENVSSQLLGQLAVSEHSQRRLFNGPLALCINDAMFFFFPSHLFAFFILDLLLISLDRRVLVTFGTSQDSAAVHLICFKPGHF